MAHRTTVGKSITLPINLVTMVDEKLDLGFGVPKGSYSGLIKALLEKWIIEQHGERIVATHNTEIIAEK